MNQVPARLKSSGPEYQEPWLDGQHRLSFSMDALLNGLTENEMSSCKNRSFQHSNKKPESVKLIDTGDTTLGKCTDAPEDFESRKQPASPYLELDYA